MYRHSRTEAGFTIIELLVVIIVIGILAAITVVAFNGVQKRAVEASLQSDLRNAASTLFNEQATNGKYPGTAAAANGGAGLKASGSNTYTYLAYPSGYCISATSPQAGAQTFYYSTRTGKVQAGVCDSVVETFAGSGTSGSADGTGTAAQFHGPSRLTFGADGTLYVANGSGSTNIRKVTTSGVVSTLTALGSFNGIYGMEMGPDGFLYVSDSNNNRIRRVNPTTGAITTFAGSGTAGSANGVGTAAQFDFPMALDFDSQGNLFVMDSDNYRIRKVAPDGTVTTFAGSSYGYTDATGTAAQFGFTEGLAIDDSDNIFVTDQDNQRIRKITPAGVVTTYSGSGTFGFQDGAANVARFSSYSEIAIDSLGMLYIADNGNNRIRKVAPDGSVTTLAGTNTGGHLDGPGSTARLNNPWGVAFGPEGKLYVGDAANHRIRVITQP